MKRRWTLLWACMVMLCAVLLVGCGGSSEKASEGEAGTKEEAQATDGTKEEGTAEEPEPAAPAPEEKFIGSWKMAAVEMDGLTIVGDLSTFVDQNTNVTLTLDEGGTGTMVFGDNTGEFTWELKDDDTITMHAVKDEGSEDSEDVDSEEADDSEESVAEESLMDSDDVEVVFKDDALVIEMKDEEHQGHMFFTKDGEMEGMSPIDASAATPITSIDTVAGTWKFSGMNMMGVSMYGDADDLAEMIGESQDMTFTINTDGTAKFMGEDVTVEVGEDGAKLVVEGFEAKLLMDGDAILLDMSNVESELAMIFRFTK